MTDAERHRLNLFHLSTFGRQNKMNKTRDLYLAAIMTENEKRSLVSNKIPDL
jgi:hypothetical protein